MCRSPNPPVEEGYKRVVMCSGKVYYELAKKRADEKKEKEVAIIRLEQVQHCPTHCCCMEWQLAQQGVSMQSRCANCCPAYSVYVAERCTCVRNMQLLLNIHTCFLQF